MAGILSRMTYRFPQLVRVAWVDRQNRRKTQVAMGRLAASEDDALDVANALEFCMVPRSARKLQYQVSALHHKATGVDALSRDTHWVTFWREGQGFVKPKALEFLG